MVKKSEPLTAKRVVIWNKPKMLKVSKENVGLDQKVRGQE